MPALTNLVERRICTRKKGGNPGVTAFELLLQPPWLIIIYSP
jgi:hypothetical protein